MIMVQTNYRIVHSLKQVGVLHELQLSSHMPIRDAQLLRDTYLSLCILFLLQDAFPERTSTISTELQSRHAHNNIYKENSHKRILLFLGKHRETARASVSSAFLHQYKPLTKCPGHKYTTPVHNNTQLTPFPLFSDGPYPLLALHHPSARNQSPTLNTPQQTAGNRPEPTW